MKRHSPGLGLSEKVGLEDAATECPSTASDDVASLSDVETPVAKAARAQGYRSLLPRQAEPPPGLELRVHVAKLREGAVELREGSYLFVVMVADPERLRLLHLDAVEASGFALGHSSLVALEEFSRFREPWRAHDARGFKATVLYAGELCYEPGEGVLWWSNCSGHYRPEAEDRDAVALDPSTFVPARAH